MIRRIFGYVCLILGGICILCGLVLGSWIHRYSEASYDLLIGVLDLAVGAWNVLQADEH